MDTTVTSQHRPAESAMTEVINLKIARKRKAREQAARVAAGRRASFGRTPAEKARDKAAVRTEQEKLDHLRLDPPPKR